MHDIERKVMSEGLMLCWKAAGIHLSQQVNGAIQFCHWSVLVTSPLCHSCPPASSASRTRDLFPMAAPDHHQKQLKRRDEMIEVNAQAMLSRIQKILLTTATHYAIRWPEKADWSTVQAERQTSEGANLHRTANPCGTSLRHGSSGAVLVMT